MSCAQVKQKSLLNIIIDDLKGVLVANARADCFAAKHASCLSSLSQHFLFLCILPNDDVHHAEARIESASCSTALQSSCTSNTGLTQFYSRQSYMHTMCTLAYDQSCTNDRRTHTCLSWLCYAFAPCRCNQASRQPIYAYSYHMSAAGCADWAIKVYL